MGKGTVKCNEPGCERYVVGWGLCNTHYKRWYRHGSSKITLRPEDWGQREKHDLYDAWNEVRNKSPQGCCEEWNDFWVFVKSVGEKPGKRYSLYRKDNSKPWSNDNFYWHEWQSEHPAKSKEYSKEYRQKNVKSMHGYGIYKSYRIRTTDYDRMLSEQNGVCKICFQNEKSLCNWNKRPRSLAVDHCHATGKVRGLLCSNCNRALGGFKDDINLLQCAIAYLNEHK